MPTKVVGRKEVMSLDHQLTTTLGDQQATHTQVSMATSTGKALREAVQDQGLLCQANLGKRESKGENNCSFFKANSYYFSVELFLDSKH